MYSEVPRERDGKGYATNFSRVLNAGLTGCSFVEFESPGDLKTAVEKLDQSEFKGATVTCVSDVSVKPHVSVLSEIDVVTATT